MDVKAAGKQAEVQIERENLSDWTSKQQKSKRKSKNDISFVIDSEPNLYEHQSSVNKNMPIRGLIYLTELYKGYIERNGLRIYNETPVKLPFPRWEHPDF